MALAGFLGCGNMGGILAAAATKMTDSGEILGADHHPEKLRRLHTDCGVVPADAREIAETCRFIFLGVKPQGMAQASAEIRDILSRRTDPFVLVSMAAGLSITSVSELFGVGGRVIRIMPNTPAAVGAGVILYCTGGDIDLETEQAFLGLLDAAGTLVKLEEAKFDAASAVTGCGPAFVCLFMESLVDGAVRCGLPRNLALEFVQRTVLGTAKLSLESGQDPALLRAAVCSPGGSTIAGVAAMEEHAVRFAAMEAVQAAFLRTVELGGPKN